MGQGPKTNTIGVNSGSQTAVTVLTDCRKVVVYENAQAGTTDYFVRIPAAGDAQIQKVGGSKHEIFAHSQPGGWFPAGFQVCTLQTVSGSPTFVIEEH
jgi:hypothetical protein